MSQEHDELGNISGQDHRKQLFAQTSQSITEQGLGNSNDLSTFLQIAKALGGKEGYALTVQLEKIGATTPQLEQIRNIKKEVVMDAFATEPTNGGPWLKQTIADYGYNVGTHWIDDKDKVHSPLRASFGHISGYQAEFTVQATADNRTYVIYQQVAEGGPKHFDQYLREDDVYFFNEIYKICHDIDPQNIVPILIHKGVAYTNMQLFPIQPENPEQPPTLPRALLAMAAIPLYNSKDEEDFVIGNWESTYSREMTEHERDETYRTYLEGFTSLGISKKS